MAKWGSFDFKEIKKLQKQLEKLEQEQDAFNRECINELAGKLLKKVKQRTPVGRPPKLKGSKTVNVKVRDKDGKIRTRSFLSKKGEILVKYWSDYHGGKLRNEWAVGEVQKIGDIYTIEIINPMSYASYVEYGHRQTPGRYVPMIGKRLKKGWVPGKFMLTISEKQLNEQAPKILEKNLEKKLQEVFHAK